MKRLQKFSALCALSCLIQPGRAEFPTLYGDTAAHDPSTMIRDGARYFVFRTSQGIEGIYSFDLRNWIYAGRVFPGAPPAWTTAAVPGFTGTFWAPDVAYFNDLYHLYYAVSSFGTIDSAIGLVTTPSLTNPTWTDQGKVVQSDPACCVQPETDTTSINTIDPSILVAANGSIWMSFGSYFDGIAVIQINPATGKRLNTTSIGTKIASSSLSSFGNITEASYLYQRGAYYYLFLNYGSCCSGVDSTYNIRVGRSQNVTGPYLDRNGANMIGGGGTPLLESSGRFIGPGHVGIMNDNGTNWFTFHYYDGNNNGAPRLGLTRLNWTPDGWPAITNDWSAFYTFDVNATEHRGIYSGSFQNGVTIASEPDRGKMVQLNGAGAYVRLPDPVANARTFMAWVKWNGGADWQRIFDFGVDTTKYLFLTPRAANGKMHFGIKNGGGEPVIDAPDSLPINSWVHVAVTLDGARGVLYQNGLPIGTNNSMPILPWQLLCRTNFIGDSQYPADPTFNGKIDSFRIFGRALSGAEIKDIAWAHPSLAHRYSFNTDARDTIGMAHGTLIGNGTVNSGALQLTGVASDFVELPNGYGGMVSRCSAVTFECWATFGTNSAWARLFDFGATSGAFGSQYVFFSPHTGSDGQRLEISTSAGTFTRDIAGTLDNRSVHVVCILDPPNNYAAIYTNGVLEFQATAAIPPLSGVSPNYAYIGHSLFSADAGLNAAIDEFRIYDGRLTPEEITANFNAGPGALALAARLTATNTPTTLSLTWPSWALDFTPESTTNLTANLWSPIPLPAILSSDRWSLTLPKTDSAQFVRLKR
jgi:hypothetical protein